MSWAMDVANFIDDIEYSKEEIAQLWGGNLLRVLDEVQEVAKNYAPN